MSGNEIEYRVLSRIRRGGEIHPPGGALALPLSEAQQLLEQGVIEGPLVASPPTKPVDAETLSAAIRDVAVRLGVRSPAVRRLSEELGYPVTAAERDAALAERGGS